MPPAQLSQAQRNSLCSPLSNLRTDVNFRTKHPSNSKFLLDVRQVSDWPDFEKEMRSHLANQIGDVSKATILKSNETFGVGNELGVQARFTQNVYHVVGEMVQALGYKVNFADYQYGRCRVQRQNKRKRTPIRSRRVPDIVVVHSPSHDIRIIGEIKTEWTFRPKKNQPWKEFLCDKMGQLARYMDDHYCRYGFFTTYDHTWFLKRTDNYHFVLSKAISSTAQSNQTSISVRECFLALAICASKDASTAWPTMFGHELTKRGYHPPARQTAVSMIRQVITKP